MGLERISQPGGPDAGLFNLPPGFDTNKYAAEFVVEGQVAFKEQRQSIPGSGISADGWTLYKIGNKPYKVVNGKDKTFFLMVRPRLVQDQVNALCGNISKKRLQREIQGDTIAGSAVDDSGMLPEQRLKTTREGASFEGGGGDTDMNEIPDVEDAAALVT